MVMEAWEGKPKSSASGVRPAPKALVDCFSTHFLEYEFKAKDLLVHLFPRGGAEDRWYPPSIRDGRTIPGRLEEPVLGLSFPDDMTNRIERAASSVWAGDISADYVPELKAYAIQFLEAANTLKQAGPESFVELFAEAIDRNLEG
jgi:hypothetical protein